MSPAKKVAVVACMDARLDPVRALGIEEGVAHVIRNAGGVVTDDVIRSLAISRTLLNTEEIILVHHTDCGMLSFTDEQLLGQLEESAGERPEWSPLSFDDLDQNVRDSIRRIEESPFVAHKDVRGFVYELETGKLREAA